MYVVSCSIIVRKEIHFILPFFIAPGRGGGSDNLETLIALAYLEARNFFYSLAGNVKNSSIKTMVNSFTVICPQCRKRLDQSNIDMEDSPGAQAAASLNTQEAAGDVCPPRLDEVRIRYDQQVKA